MKADKIAIASSEVYAQKTNTTTYLQTVFNEGKIC